MTKNKNTEDKNADEEKSMKAIIIEKRTDDCMAYLEGHREIWGCGKDFDSAIGDLIR